MWLRLPQMCIRDRYQADAPYWGYQDEAIWQDFADWLYERGLIAEQFDGAATFTNEYLPQ